MPAVLRGDVPQPPGGPADLRRRRGAAARPVPADRPQLALAAQVGDPLVRMGSVSEVGIESGIDRRQPQPAWAVAIGLSLGPTNLAAPAAAAAVQQAPDVNQEDDHGLAQSTEFPARGLPGPQGWRGGRT